HAGDAGAHATSGIDAATSTPPSSPTTTPSFASNTPGADVHDVGTPPTPDLVLISSNLVQKPSGGQIFQQWFGEVQNNGSQIVCQVRAKVSFKDASGTELATFEPYADADPYDGPGTLTIPCIAPGKIGTFYMNGFVPANAPIENTKTIEVAFNPN